MIAIVCVTLAECDTSIVLVSQAKELDKIVTSNTVINTLECELTNQKCDLHLTQLCEWQKFCMLEVKTLLTIS